MVDRLLAVAGACAFRANRTTTAILRSPAITVTLVLCWLAAVAGVWYPLLLAVPAALLRLGRTRAPGKPPIRDFDAAPLVAAVALLVLAATLSLGVQAMPFVLRAAVAIVAAALAAIVLLGWRIGYLIFRAERGDPEPSTTAIAPRTAAPVQASGVLLGRDCVFRLEDDGRVEWRVAIARSMANYDRSTSRVLDAASAVHAEPAGAGDPASLHLVLVTDDGAAGLTLGHPDVTSFEPGVAPRDGSADPALRLRTELGPLVLAFASTVERDAVAVAIREALP